jgi:transcriptional regulator with XRE-family HTH domain
MTTPNPSPAGVEIDGAKVRKARKLRGQNLISFAPLCGITFQYLSQIERGERLTVSPRTFAAICDAFGLAEANREELIRTQVAA